MTNEQLFDDLKQFVQVSISQGNESLKKELLQANADLRDEVISASNDQTATILSHFDELAEDAHNHGARLDDHDGRIASLEQAAA